MYSGACCLRCYRRAAYGADSIRAKLALDNPSDRARPDRPASASPPASCVPRAPVTGRHLRHGACGHGRGRARGRAGGPRGPGKGPGVSPAEGAQTSRQRGLLGASQRALSLPSECTLKVTHWDGLPGPLRGGTGKVREAGRGGEDRALAVTAACASAGSWPRTPRAWEPRPPPGGGDGRPFQSPCQASCAEHPARSVCEPVGRRAVPQRRQRGRREAPSRCGPRSQCRSVAEGGAALRAQRVPRGGQGHARRARGRRVGSRGGGARGCPAPPGRRSLLARSLPPSLAVPSPLLSLAGWGRPGSPSRCQRLWPGVRPGPPCRWGPAWTFSRAEGKAVGPRWPG